MMHAPVVRINDINEHVADDPDVQAADVDHPHDAAGPKAILAIITVDRVVAEVAHAPLDLRDGANFARLRVFTEDAYASECVS